MLISPALSELAGWIAEHATDARTGTTWVDRRTGRRTALAHLEAARAAYTWRFTVRAQAYAASGHTYDDSAALWEQLERDLRASVRAGDDDAALATAGAVLEWGGAINHNRAWLAARSHGLAELLAEAAHRLALGGPDAAVPSTIRFNSGLSKVYAALVDGLVIYDSRVAAALGGLAVTCWGGVDRVPEEARLPTTQGRGTQNRRVTDDWPALRSGRPHALAARRASLVIGEVVR